MTVLVSLPGYGLLEKLSLELLASVLHEAHTLLAQVPFFQQLSAIIFILINQYVTIALTVPSNPLRRRK